MAQKEQVKIEDLFTLEESLAGEYMKGFTYPWEVLAGIHDLILQIGPTLPEDLYDHPSEDVWIAKSAKVFETAYIGGACIIGERTQVRQAAFIRGDALIGNDCVVGNSAELKNVIIFNNCEVPHYNYVGDSILGFHAHMGAGSITSNVKADKKNIMIHCDGTHTATGLRKIGAILGDWVDVGCNSVLNPGSVVGPHTNIYPLSMIRGTVPAWHVYKDKDHVVEKIVEE